MSDSSVVRPGAAPRFAEHRPPTAFARTTVDYGGPTARCVCGHNQGKHEIPGFDGECISEGCRCTQYRAKLPELVPASPPVARPAGATAPSTPARLDTVEALVAAARETGDKRALLVIGRIQSMAAELSALIAAHRANTAAHAARERDEQFKAQLAAMPKVRKAGEPKATNRITDGAYPCPVDGCGHVSRAPQGVAAHRRAVHEQTEVACPGCGRKVKRTGLGAHRARFCPGTELAS